MINHVDAFLRKWGCDRVTFFFFVVVVLLLTGYVVYPAVRVLVQSLIYENRFSVANYREFFITARAPNLTALWHSVYISLMSVLFAGLVGVPLALFFHRFSFPGAGFFSALAIIPFVLPPLIGVISFMFLLGESGIIPRGLQWIFNLDEVPFKLEGVWAILTVHAYSFFVYFYLFVSSALRNIDNSMEEAAANLGAGGWRRFRTIVFPLLTPAVVGASLLVFMISMASFSAPYIFSGGYRILSVQIYQSKLNGDMPMALTQTVILAAISFCFLLFMRWYSERRIYRMAGKGVARPRQRVSGRWQRIVLLFIGSGISLLLLLPHLMIFLMSFVQDGTWTYQILPPAYTWKNYLRLFSERGVFTPIANSLRMAGIATAVAILIGVISAYILRLRTFRGRYFLEILVMLPWALPGTAIAIFLLTTFNRPSFLTGGVVITSLLLPLSYLIRHLPILVRSSHAAFEQIDPSLEDASRNLGAGWWHTFRRILAPLIFPAVAAGALLVFVTCLGEFISSILLYVPSNKPISIEILSQLNQFRFGSAASYSVFLIVIITVTMVITQRWTKRGRMLF